ncbi:cutinase family protein [Mycobacterium sp. CPCC 205372]|uniref:Cutinase n=1 Tax=Mycobacterium hippophais TaxID=3016340 RepID=A0ABT4Q1J4_9MYCO|nr:cutinase family protein [Mycobacterium hippophais]MCZ8382717.1 cutinase family protein [Mycobacterium hippophais]
MTTSAASRATAVPPLFRRLAVGVAVLAAVLGPQAAGVATADPSCPDVEAVFARGTFEAPGVGATGQAFVDALDARLPGRSVEAYGVDYPASLDFQAAVGGVADTAAKVEAIAATCPDTRIVLGGYSQGAAVAAYTTADSVPAGVVLPSGLTGPLPASVAPHVAAVVLFGLPDSWFLGLVDHSAPPITIGNAYAPKTLQLCAAGDPVCAPGGLDRTAHSSYKSNGMTEQAADFAVNALNLPAPQGDPATVQ